MADGGAARDSLVLPHMTKAEKTKVAGNIGMLIYDTTANKLSFKKAADALIGSWELVTSAADS
jgi:hypothetical protein